MTNNEIRRSVDTLDRVLVVIKDKTFEGYVIDFDESTGYVCVQWDTGSVYWCLPHMVDATLDREFALL